MDVKKLIYFCNSNFWYVFEVRIESIYNEIRSSFNHYGNMSKRKADFGTLEKENKRTNSFAHSWKTTSLRSFFFFLFFSFVFCLFFFF